MYGKSALALALLPELLAARSIGNTSTRKSVVVPRLDSPRDPPSTKSNYCDRALLHKLGALTRRSEPRSKFGTMGTHRNGIMRDPILTPFMSLQEPKEPPAKVLLKLIFQCRFREASIPHDKVYSLLDLVASNGSNPPVAPSPAHPPLGIKPDYSSHVDTAYTHVARQMILVSNTLDVLGGCGGSSPTPALDPTVTLPSWVPDWRIAQHASPLVYDALDQQRTTHATAYWWLDVGPTRARDSKPHSTGTAAGASNHGFNKYDKRPRNVGGWDRRDCVIAEIPRGASG
ncbi:Heterokaryon incompatibility [Penicillium solitum]|uniref:Heterokaryon incompatibility n=1 Tax=Penicillium solitum TaxID=60172 RepID=UPI0032C43203|nr:Heterokaryon incompatibility [Penicillium solitum]